MCDWEYLSRRQTCPLIQCTNLGVWDLETAFGHVTNLPRFTSSTVTNNFSPYQFHLCWLNISKQLPAIKIVSNLLRQPHIGVVQFAFRVTLWIASNTKKKKIGPLCWNKWNVLNGEAIANLQPFFDIECIQNQCSAHKRINHRQMAVLDRVCVLSTASPQHAILVTIENIIRMGLPIAS